MSSPCILHFLRSLFPFSLWQKQSISYDQRWKALSFSTVITGISDSKHSIRLMNNRNKQTQALAEEFRLVMQKKRMKGFSKTIGVKKRKMDIVTKWMPTKKNSEWIRMNGINSKKTATWQKNVLNKKISSMYLRKL